MHVHSLLTGVDSLQIKVCPISGVPTSRCGLRSMHVVDTYMRHPFSVQTIYTYANTYMHKRKRTHIMQSVIRSIVTDLALKKNVESPLELFCFSYK